LAQTSWLDEPRICPASAGRVSMGYYTGLLHESTGLMIALLCLGALPTQPLIE
jgi:hypothetical protein